MCRGKWEIEWSCTSSAVLLCLNRTFKLRARKNLWYKKKTHFIDFTGDIFKCWWNNNLFLISRKELIHCTGKCTRFYLLLDQGSTYFPVANSNCLVCKLPLYWMQGLNSRHPISFREKEKMKWKDWNVGDQSRLHTARNLLRLQENKHLFPHQTNGQIRKAWEGKRVG